MRERSVFPLAGGRLRPGIIAAFIVLLFVLGTSNVLLIFTLGLLAFLTLLLIVLRKQRRPVWTNKARILVAGTFLLDVICSVIISFLPLDFLFLPFLVLLQAVMLFFIWAAFLPVDQLMKRRIFLAAKTVRESHPELLVIGITGSVGKTTTKELLAQVLADRRPLFTPSHVNTEVGVAQWMLKNVSGRTFPQDTPLIIEMGAYRKGEIANLCSIVQPRMGIVTFIGTQHLALFGSAEALLEAKGELLQALPTEGQAFLNGDCERCREMARFCACPVTVVGTGGAADLEATDIEETTTGIRFTVGDLFFSLPLRGTHNVSNILLAIAAAEHIGISRTAIAERLRTFQPPHRTFELRTERGVTILDDTHNASSASFQAAIAWTKSQPFEHKALLTSGIIELGEEHERTHRELGSLSADVFESVIFLDSKSASFFGEGYGKPVAILTRETPPVLPGSMLVCVGRMTPATIQRLLPTE